MKHYELSVIIPVHNTALELFDNCIASLKEQDIGFENIEVIIVFHNCGRETVEGARRILPSSDNVLTAELNNDSHSPSSPRNYGIDMATGEYISFLDSDDMLTPECLRVSLGYIRKSNADLCHFRKKIVLEKEGNITFNELVLWDQTRDMIVWSRDALDQRAYFAGAWGMSTGKLIRRQILIENNLRFDESIRFAEDYHFMLSIFSKLETICLAPQLIGYIYYVNGQSLVQTTKISEELLLEYVAGFKKVFDKGLENHIWMNDTMGSVMLIILNWMRACTDLSHEGRTKIHELMGPYIRSLEPVQPSKLYPDGKYYRMNAFLTRYILRQEPKLETYIARENEGRGKTFLDRQKDALSEILRNGMQCDYSRHYGFAEITTIEEYQRRLPVADYGLYAPMIQLTIQMGERGIFTDNEIIAYVLAGGTESGRNRFPVTYKAIVPYIHAFRKSAGAGKTFLTSEALPFEASRLTMDYKYTNTVFGVLLKEYIAEAESFGSGYASFTTPKEYLLPAKEQDLKLLRLVFALQERDVETVFAPDPDSLCSCLRDLKDAWIQVCELIEAYDKERADELRALFAGGEIPSLARIWPSIKKIVCWNLADDKEIESVKSFLKDVPLARGYFADEYALYGSYSGGSGEVALEADDVFYEFVPLGDVSEKAVCTAAGLHEQEAYQLLLSNLSGLYRYDTGLSVQCVHSDEESVVIRLIP